MTHIRAFQFLVVASVVFYLAWVLMPYAPRSLSPQDLNLLSWSGYGSVPLFQHPFFYLAIGAAKLIASIGLLLFLSWGRWLLVAVVVISIAALPFSGISIAAPLDSVVGAFTGLTDGAIIALAFSSPIAERWRKDD